MPKTPAEMIEAVTRNLQKNTGKSAAEWRALLATFAVVKPQRARVDVGLCLDKSVKPAGRLTLAKHLGSDRVTHKIQLTSAAEVDATLTRWLRTAYDLA